MPDILHELPIAAPLSRVHEALVSERGLSSWFSADCSAAPEVGHLDIVHLDDGAELHLRVETLREDRVRWVCERGPRVPEEWIDTAVVFSLEARDDQTILRLGHLGWATTQGAYARWNTTWADLLGRLQACAEGRAVSPRFPT